MCEPTTIGLALGALSGITSGMGAYQQNKAMEQQAENASNVAAQEHQAQIAAMARASSRALSNDQQEKENLLLKRMEAQQEAQRVGAAVRVASAESGLAGATMERIEDQSLFDFLAEDESLSLAEERTAANTQFELVDINTRGQSAMNASTNRANSIISQSNANTQSMGSIFLNSAITGVGTGVSAYGGAKGLGIGK